MFGEILLSLGQNKVLQTTFTKLLSFKRTLFIEGSKHGGVKHLFKAHLPSRNSKFSIQNRLKITFMGSMLLIYVTSELLVPKSCHGRF